MTFPRLSSPFLAAPMVGVSDVAFRIMCKRAGAGMCFTEMTMADSVLRRGVPVCIPEEHPVAIQLAGNDPEKLALAAQRCSDYQVIDLNCGCPAHKAVKIGTGASLLMNPERIGALVEAMTAAVEQPITVKIRIGPSEKSINAIDVARIIEEHGAAAVTVHGRTAQQGYSGKSRWDVIRDVRKAVRIPVIANGDVFTAQDAVRLLQDTGCSHVMIGRAAACNPRIFAECNAVLQGKTVMTSPEEKMAQCHDYLELAKEHAIPFAVTKDHVAHFTKGIKGSTRIREAITKTRNVHDLMRVLSSIDKNGIES